MEDRLFSALVGLMNRGLDLPAPRCNVWPEGVEEWKMLFESAVEQRVLPLAMAAAEQLPPEFRPKGKPLLPFFALSEKCKSEYKHKVDVLKWLAATMGRNGMDLMVLKGFSLSRRYPDPSLRFFGDLDYYLYGKSAEGEKALEGEGVKSSGYYHHHTQASREDVLLENHYDFFDRENHRCNLLLDDTMKGLALSEGHDYPLSLGDNVVLDHVFRMSPTMEAVFLMRHMSAHFVAAEMEFRQLYDWVLFLRDDGSRVDWATVNKLYEESGMMQFARILSWIIEHQLHVEVPASLAASDPDDTRLAFRIWDDIKNPSAKNDCRKDSFKYYILEARIFLRNRWKHQLVYPGESWLALMLNYLKLKIRLGR